MNQLTAGETGGFGELAAKDNPELLVVSYIPPIEAMLERARQLKGKELSPTEVERIRNDAPAIALPPLVHEATFGSGNQ